MAESKNEGNIKNNSRTANGGMDMDNSINQIGNTKISYGLNAMVESFDNTSTSYQNEPGNELCLSFPSGYILILKHYIQERNKHIFFLVNSSLGASEIGYMDNNDCIYHTLVNSPCLGFDANHPIHQMEHKISNCSTDIYWADHIARRHLDIDNIPYLQTENSSLCDPQYTDQLDCNQLKMQPNFKIPQLEISDIITGGELLAGDYQFAIQYSDSSSNPYTSYYSITNPTPIADISIITPNFNYNVGKSIIINISNIDDSGQFQYFNLAVIKTINNIASVELIGTYFIDSLIKTITYTGQQKELIRLSINDIFEKYPYYDVAEGVTAVQDVLVWEGLTTIDRINYQDIANKITLQWETYKISDNENYSDELNATNLRGYLRDEVYAFEFVPLLKNGKQGDSFHIPGRALSPYDNSFPDVPNTSSDFIGEPTYYDDITGIGYSPYWKIYNTGSVSGNSQNNPIGNATSYEYGDFAYWESNETYPCNDDVWGELAGKPIRHHKFPDTLISPIFESGPLVYNGENFTPIQQTNSVFPIGVRVDIQQISSLINSSNLTPQQKSDIVGFKIVRGDRGTNKSIIAKGILRNVNTYIREEQTYYYPNYPYNDLEADPFLNLNNNAFSDIAEPWLIICEQTGTYTYTDPNTNKISKEKPMVAGEIIELCSTTRPIYKTGRASIGPANYDAWHASSFDCKGYDLVWTDPFNNNNLSFTNESTWLAGYLGGNHSIDVRVFEGTTAEAGIDDECDNGDGPFSNPCKCYADYYPLPYTTQAVNVIDTGGGTYSQPAIGRRSSLTCKEETPLPPASSKEENKYRQVFNSPETSFGQPFLGNVLKLENVIFGGGKAHFVEVKNNAKYKLLSEEAQRDAFKSSNTIASITSSFNSTALFTAYQAYLTIYINGITRKNYAYSFNSIAEYNYSLGIPNNEGVKQRELELKQYLIPGVQSVGDNYNVNNYDRESSVYLKTEGTKDPLPFPNESPNLIGTNIKDYSRFTVGDTGACSTPAAEQDITVLSYYGSIKNVYEGQWGQIYSYQTVDTGFQKMLDGNTSLAVAFGGDTFISKFAFKTKLPFFIDNRVGAPDDADIFYDEIGNIAYPKYWHSARSILENASLASGQTMTNFISYKAHHFDCPNDPASIVPNTTGAGAFGSYRTYYDGLFYLFAYGIPSFYCESSYNVDLRQAFNNREGDFWPHVSTGIPDDWVQESFVSIKNDNTYNYNVTYSKQNKENEFTHLPPDWGEVCKTLYPFRAIYSDPQDTNSDARINNWLIYKPLSFFDFPQNYGKLTSLDGIENKAILARFENKSLLYNHLLTINTSNPQAAYLGNPNLFQGAPPIDFAETDLGYVGSQNKFILKIPEGQITVDAKRGQVFLIQGTQAVDLTGYGSGVNKFFTDHLSFEISNYFPNVSTDNHYTGVGLHGVYDSKFNRVIITKLDYTPLSPDIKYDEEKNEYYIETIIDIPTTSTTTTSTTTIACNVWTYNVAIYNCGDCTQTGGGGICNSQPLTVGKWYFWNNFKILITAFVECSVGSCEYNIEDSNQEDNCEDFICPTTTTTTTICPCTIDWTKQNLDVTTYRNGDPIPEVTDYTVWATLTTGAWCYYNNNPANGAIYGKMYNWYAINDPRGLAPIGWHVPSITEWTTLRTCMGGQSVAGGALKQVGTTTWLSPNTGATDSCNFTALAAGNRAIGFFPSPLAFDSQQSINTNFWTATEVISDPLRANVVFFVFNTAAFNLSTAVKECGFSVRLIQD